MKFLNVFIIFVFCFLFSLCFAHEKNSSNTDFPTDNVDSILKLDAENYEKRFKNTENLFVFFYSPFCRYSLKTASSLVQLSTFLPQYNLDNKKIHIAQFNINNDKETADELKVEGSPAFRYYKKGVLVKEYDGARTTIGLFNFILHCLDLYSVELTNSTQLEGFISFYNDVVVYFGDNKNVSSFKKAIKDDLSDELLVGHVIFSDNKEKNSEDIKEILQKTNINKNTVLLYKNKRPEKPYFPSLKGDEDDYSSIHQYFLLNLYPYVLTFTEETASYIFSQGKPALFFYSSPKDYEKYHKFITEELPASVRERILIYLLGAEGNEDVEGRLFSIIKANHFDFPSVKIHKREEKLLTENMKNDITVDNVVNFINDWFVNGFVNFGVKDRVQEEVHNDDL